MCHLTSNRKPSDKRRLYRRRFTATFASKNETGYDYKAYLAKQNGDYHNYSINYQVNLKIINYNNK